jgi:hypothetical protein
MDQLHTHFRIPRNTQDNPRASTGTRPTPTSELSRAPQRTQQNLIHNHQRTRQLEISRQTTDARTLLSPNL